MSKENSGIENSMQMRDKIVPMVREEHVSLEILPEHLERVASAFVYKQKYPLSPDGEILKAKAQAALESGDRTALEKLKDSLPTVEQPHLELFKDLEIPPEAKKYFGYNLTNLQVVEGCPHQCLQCAADSSDKVKYMPYAAFLKITEAQLDREDEAAPLLQAWGPVLKRFTEENLGEMRSVYSNFGRFLQQMRAAIDLGVDKYVTAEMDDQLGMIVKHVKQYNVRMINLFTMLQKRTKMFNDFFNAVEKKDKNQAARLRASYAALTEQTRQLQDKATKKYTASGMESVVEPLKGEILVDDEGLRDRGMIHYYDSDPFTYRDYGFLHTDGSPAHLGDVIASSTKEGRVIKIVTHGWDSKDKVANRAAVRIAQISQEYNSLPIYESEEWGTVHGLLGVSISVHPWSRPALRDKAQFLDRIRNMVRRLFPLIPTLALYGGSVLMDNKFTNTELEELMTLSRRLGMPIHFYRVSRFSGRLAHGADKVKEHDVMANMGGHRITPDGQIWDCHAVADSIKNKGSRPKPTGIRLWH